jgi:type IV secretion system protein VirB9
MKFIASLAVAVLCGTVLQASHAESNPTKSHLDSRIRYVDYNDADVATLDTVVNVNVMIVLESGETVLDWAFGDSEAYAFAPKDNVIYLKPKADNADTNLNIRTNKRRYALDLRFHSTGRKYAVQQLVYRYPETEIKKTQDQKKTASLEEAFKARRDGYNLEYEMSGDLAIGPINVWDNNEATCFKFPGNVDLPAIYVMTADGSEAVAPRHVFGASDHVKCYDQVAKKWVVRQGDSVVGVFNNNFDAIGVSNESRTVSPAVQRVLKGSK